MFYSEDDIDLEGMTFESDEPNGCLVCGPWGMPGYMGKPKGGLRMCLSCNGTGKKGGKSPSLPEGVYDLPSKGRDAFGGRTNQ